MTTYSKISEADLETIKVLAEQEKQDICTEVIEKRKAYVFRFEKTKPYVVPKEVKECWLDTEHEDCRGQ